MKNETDSMTKVESKPVLGSDWVDAHADYLFNFAIGQVRDAHIAEDLVQDTFLAAVKAQNSFGGKSSARTWLVGILRHKICDYFRDLARPAPRLCFNSMKLRTKLTGKCVRR